MRKRSVTQRKAWMPHTRLRRRISPSMMALSDPWQCHGRAWELTLSSSYQVWQPNLHSCP
eukprot:6331854-Prorocentrum_lima.AAC.1